MKSQAWALLLAVLAAAGPARAQWQIEDSGTTADLRGIDNVGGGVAWASGTNGTVLRTEDGGYLWQNCTIPPGAEHLDFRGIQAFDANTAIVMSSGKGDLSRLYKTTDGCETWKLVFTNPDKDGFWDGISVDWSDRNAIVIGDPVGGRFALFFSDDRELNEWRSFDRSRLRRFVVIPTPHSSSEALFAASNSILIWHGSLDTLLFATGGSDGAFMYRPSFTDWPPTHNSVRYLAEPVPLAVSSSGGVFSFSSDSLCFRSIKLKCALVAVGGDYSKPNENAGTAGFLAGGGTTWTASTTPPNGYRSAVAYDAAGKTWITVGPNGTDISTDEGRNWRALHPDPALHEAPDADRNWNALSLPFVVGPHGRIGKLNSGALSPRALLP
jgi:hypothetical protein